MSGAARATAGGSASASTMNSRGHVRIRLILSINQGFARTDATRQVGNHHLQTPGRIPAGDSERPQTENRRCRPYAHGRQPTLYVPRSAPRIVAIVVRI